MAREGNIVSPDEQRQFDDLEFRIKRSIRYHNHRRLFFDRLDKFIKIFSLVTGSGAFATAVASHQGLTVMFAALVAILSAINLVVAAAQAAQLHEELASRFAELECQIKRAGPVNSEQLNAFIADRLAIESDEPPALRVLDTICHNELCRALGYKSYDFYKVDPVQSFFPNIIDLWPWRMKRQTMRAEHYTVQPEFRLGARGINWRSQRMATEALIPILEKQSALSSARTIKR